MVRQVKLFPYPELPAPIGYGNADDVSSYVSRVSKALRQPVQWLGKLGTIMIWCNNQGTNCRETRGPGNQK